jgi:AraC family transcriptional regulator
MLKTLERPAITVVGLAIRTRPMSPDIPALWPKFVARIDEIENLSEPRVSYGVMRHGGGDMEDLHYMAAVAVSNASRIPPGMESLTIPAGNLRNFPLSACGTGPGLR